MKVEKEDLEKINEQMKGWTVERVSSGTGASETIFIIHLVKGKNKRMVKLAGNDLGGWLEK
jgi:hypothetical protein